jgi:hypothetical protein
MDPIIYKSIKSVESKVDSIADYLSYEADITSWETVQHIVRAGLAPRIFSIGDQFECLYDGAPTVWDVIGIDHDTPADPQYKHSLTIQSHDCLLNCQFDASEALYYAEAGLAVGTYNFANDGTSYQFTLTQAVPAGGCLTFPWVYNTDILTTKVSSYPSQAATVAIESVAITAGSDGTTLTPVNHMGRVRYGSNNYLQSNIRAWLNSDSATFSWSPSTIYDRPATAAPYTGGGFLERLDPELVAVIGAVSKQVAKNTVTDGGGQDLFSDKVFLLSRVETYNGGEGTTTGEAPYEYYAAMAAAPTSGELAARIKYLSGAARYWWLRSPGVGYSNSARYVDAAGSLSNIYAYSRYGAAPACCIV